MRRAYCVTAFRVSGNPTVPVGWVLNPRGTFKNLAAETGIPYQNPINLTLRECAQTGKNPRAPEPHSFLGCALHALRSWATPWQWDPDMW